MKTQLVAVREGFEDKVVLAVSVPFDVKGNPYSFQLVATHPDRPGVSVRRPFEGPQRCTLEELQNRNVWVEHLPLTWQELVTALWVSGSEAYEEVETFEAVPVGIGEIRADKTRSAADWKPRDVLVDLLRRIDSDELPNMDALVACWRERTEKGEVSSFYSASSPDIHVTLGVLSRAEYQIQRGAFK